MESSSLLRAEYTESSALSEGSRGAAARHDTTTPDDEASKENKDPMSARPGGECNLGGALEYSHKTPH